MLLSDLVYYRGKKINLQINVYGYLFNLYSQFECFLMRDKKRLKCSSTTCKWYRILISKSLYSTLYIHKVELKLNLLFKSYLVTKADKLSVFKLKTHFGRSVTCNLAMKSCWLKDIWLWNRKLKWGTPLFWADKASVEHCGMFFDGIFFFPKCTLTWHHLW